MSSSESRTPPPPDRILRNIPVRMDTETRVYIGRRLGEINTRKRRLESEKKAATAHFKAIEKDLDTESVSLEAAPPVPNGKEIELTYPCEGRVNLSTGQYDIYVLDRDEEGREVPRFVRSEPLPEQHLYLLQEDLDFEGRKGKGKGGKKDQDKKDPKDGGGDKKDDAPPDFPGEDDKKKK